MPSHYVSRDVGQLDVGVLRRPAEQVEGVIVGQAVEHHQHADGLTDRATAGEPATQRGPLPSANSSLSISRAMASLTAAVLQAPSRQPAT
jgi:hypothetical protein